MTLYKSDMALVKNDMALVKMISLLKST